MFVTDSVKVLLSLTVVLVQVTVPRSRGTGVVLYLCILLSIKDSLLQNFIVLTAKAYATNYNYYFMLNT